MKQTEEMKRMLFIAPYPDEHTIKEGMQQRIKAVDDLFTAAERVYLDISFSKNLLVKKRVVAERATVVKLNFFLHLPLIFQFYRRAEIIYCHAVYNFAKVSFFGLFVKKRVVLDMHGIVPEEKMAEGRRLLSLFYRYAEKMAFKSINLAVHVTLKMKAHYAAKYPGFTGEHSLFAIIPAHLKTTPHPDLPPTLDHEPVTGSDQKEVTIIYTGNLQVWQNIGLMLDVIRQNNHKKLMYTILTGEPKEFAAMIAAAGLSDRPIQLKSVEPEELADYYKEADYGFILRDDTPINRVANPTKMIEYLRYGIIPIVKSPDIGDFADAGYEFVSYDQPLAGLEPGKSRKNMLIAREILEQNNENRFRNAVFGC